MEGFRKSLIIRLAISSLHGRDISPKVSGIPKMEVLSERALFYKAIFRGG